MYSAKVLEHLENPLNVGEMSDATAQVRIEGIEGFEVGPELWYGSNVLTFKGERQNTLERFFLVRSPTSSGFRGSSTRKPRSVTSSRPRAVSSTRTTAG